MQTSLDIRNPWRDGQIGRHVASLASFAMLTGALCCAAVVLGERAQAPELLTEPYIAHSGEPGTERAPRLRRDWREERSAAMIERTDKCNAVSPESSPPSCLHQSL